MSKRGRDAAYTETARAWHRLHANACALNDFASANAARIFADVRSSKTYAPSREYMDTAKANVKAVFEMYAASHAPETHATLRREYENYCNALEHITYISMTALVRAVNENAMRIKEHGEEVCVVVPDTFRNQTLYLKSNMWVTLIAALQLTPTLAASIACAEDVAAVAALNCTCLLFDDCLYSGSQIMHFLHAIRAASAPAPVRAYGVPAFWHMKTSDTTAADIYPPVLAAVQQRSAHLAKATDFLSPAIWSVQPWNRLTYLQTKQADSVSFPEFMWTTDENPFSADASSLSMAGELRSLYANVMDRPALVARCGDNPPSEWILARSMPFELEREFQDAGPPPRAMTADEAAALLRANARRARDVAESYDAYDAPTPEVDPNSVAWLLHKVKATFDELGAKAPAQSETLAAEYAALARALACVGVVSVQVVTDAVAENVRLLLRGTAGQPLCVILHDDQTFFWVSLVAIGFLEPEFVAFAHRPADMEAVRRSGCTCLMVTHLLTRSANAAAAVKVSLPDNHVFLVPAFMAHDVPKRNRRVVHPAILSALETRSKRFIAPPIETLLHPSFWDVNGEQMLTVFAAQAFPDSALPQFLKNLGSSPFTRGALKIASSAAEVFDALIRRDRNTNRVALAQSCDYDYTKYSERAEECPPPRYKALLGELFSGAAAHACVTEYLRAAPARAEKRPRTASSGARSRRLRHSRHSRRSRRSRPAKQTTRAR